MRKTGRKPILTAWKVEHGVHSSATTNSSAIQHGKPEVLTKGEKGSPKPHSENTSPKGSAHPTSQHPDALGPHGAPCATCALGAWEEVRTETPGAPGSPPDHHPPDSFSSRTGASAWLRGTGGKGQTSEARKQGTPPTARSRGAVSRTPRAGATARLPLPLPRRPALTRALR